MATTLTISETGAVLTIATGFDAKLVRGVLWTETDPTDGQVPQYNASGLVIDWVDPDSLITGGFVDVAGDTMTGPLVIDGTTDAIQLRVQGHSTQTADVFVVETSAGTDLFSVATGAVTAFQNLNPNADGTLDLGLTGTRWRQGYFDDLTVTTGVVASTLTGTLQTAAQPNVTSLGTLVSLQVDNLNLDGNTLSSTAGVDLLITPLAGQQIVLDGAIIIDAGVVTGATSITSTSFVGALTGNADTATALQTARNIGGVSFDGSASIVPSTITVADTVNTTCSVALFEAATGALAPKSDAGLTYNAGTGLLTATGFSGPLTGALTGNADTATALATARLIGGVSFDGTADIVPSTITVTDSTDATSFIAMFDSATGALALRTDLGLTYDALTGTLTATALAGPLTGNADTATALQTARAINTVSFDGTSDITITAAAGTLTGATLNATVTASSLTSLGTIGSLVATTADIDGGTIDSTVIGGTTPADGTFAALIATTSFALGDDDQFQLGASADYWHVYESAGTQYLFRTSDVDGIGTDGTVWSVQDGTDDVVFAGDITAVNIAGTLTTAAQPNITSVGTLVSGAVPASLVTAGTFGTGAYVFDSTVSGITTLTATTLAGTLSTAAQPNVTSLGTLTALQVDNLLLDGNTLSSTAGVDLFITPLDGQQLILDGVIVIDAGVVTGATSITSTAFVGALTGNASTATALANPRNIGGVAFDGTGDIVPQTVQVVDSTDATSFVAMFDSATGNLQAKTDAGLSYNATTGTLTATAFSGPLTGNADTATALATPRTIGGVSFDGTANIVPSTITVADTTNTTCFVGLWESATGALAPKSDLGLAYNAGTGVLTATGFSGPLTGAVTGNADSATVLQTPRDINGVAFDGSTNITITAAAGTLTGTVLNATVVSSSLTSLGTIGSLVATSADIDGGTIDGAVIGGSARAAGSFSSLTLGTTVTITEGAADRLDLASGDSLNIVSGALQFAGSTVISSGQNLVLAGTGPHAVGGATVAATQLGLRGAFGGTKALHVTSTLTPGLTTSASLMVVAGTIVEHSTGLHPEFVGLEVQPPTITVGAATLANATTLKITGAPTATVTGAVRAFWVTSGLSEVQALTVVGTLTATLTGNADTATTLATPRTIGGVSFDGSANIVPDTITVADTADATSFVGLWESATGDIAPKTDAALTYDATTGALTAASFVGALTGNASTATALETPRTIGAVSFDGSASIVPQTIQVVDSTDASSSIAMFDSATGNLQPKTDAGLNYNATTGTLAATAFSGPLSGNATTATALATPRNIGGVAFDGTGAIVPQTIQVVDSTDASSSIAMFDSATGSLQPKTDAGLTYNASTGLLTATGFAGPLTGAVTGNADTATVLQTPRDINGVAFDGSASITVTAAAGTLTGTTLNGTVVSSSLTSLGTIGSLVATEADIATLSRAGDQTIDLTGAATRTLTLQNSTASQVANLDVDGVYVWRAGHATGTFTFAGTPTVARTLTWPDASITVNAAADISGTTLASGVVTSSLTTIGTLVGGAVPANFVTAATFAAGTFSFAGSTISDLGAVTTVDLNGGTIDGTVIGGSVAAAGSFTTLGASSLITASAGIKLGTTVTLTEGAANRLELASGDSLYLVSGTVGVGTLPLLTAGLRVGGGANITTGTTQTGVILDALFSSEATVGGRALSVGVHTEDAAFTMTVAAGIRISSPVKGASSTITTLFGLDIQDQTQGGTNYAIRTALGLVQFGDDVLTTAGTFTFAEITTPSALADYGRIYTKTDNKMYFQDGAGTEHEVAFV